MSNCYDKDKNNDIMHASVLIRLYTLIFKKHSRKKMFFYCYILLICTKNNYESFTTNIFTIFLKKDET